jgi:hypothetical protein
VLERATGKIEITPPPSSSNPPNPCAIMVQSVHVHDGVHRAFFGRRSRRHARNKTVSCLSGFNFEKGQESWAGPCYKRSFKDQLVEIMRD